jgi:ssDNA-specific exonuclease RecJ
MSASWLETQSKFELSKKTANLFSRLGVTDLPAASLTQVFIEHRLQFSRVERL